MSSRQRSKDPIDVLAEAEQQWIYTEDELLRTPSIVDGMPVEEERLLRGKSNHFLTQVGIMLKLPQTTLGTAAIFCNRYLMRCSLVKKPGYVPLHHYQVAAITLFIATKVEEHTRKLKELVIACVRVALKDPNKVVDEQTRDFWKWRDTIINFEDMLLEMLCFDLTVESPYRLLYDLIKVLNVHHEKKARDAAWAFINDTHMTQACLLFTSRTIACAALYFAARHCDVEIPDGPDGQPWWKFYRARLIDMKRAINYMADFVENSPMANGQNQHQQYESIPLGDEEDDHSYTRDRSGTPIAMDVDDVNYKSEEEVGTKLDRKRGRAYEILAENGNSSTNGGAGPVQSREPIERVLEERRPKKVRREGQDSARTVDSGSEEGEI